MTDDKLKDIINQVKGVERGEATVYETLKFVLRSIDDTEKRLSDVVSKPSLHKK